MAGGPSAAIRAECPVATDQYDGLLSAADKSKLDGLAPGATLTVTQAYNNGAAATDQTANISVAKGGAIVAKAAAVAVGSLLRALTNVSAVVFDAIDATIPKVLAVGAFIQNDPGFGSPVMGSQTPGGFMSYTSDGVGPLWGGTGMSPQANGANSAITFSLNDLADYEMNKYGLSIPISKALGVNAFTGAPEPNVFTASKFFTSANGGVLGIVANTIAPLAYVNSVGAGLIKTITPPFTGFIGSVVLRPTVAFTYDNTGNILVAGGGGTATVARDMVATYDGTKWAMSY